MVVNTQAFTHYWERWGLDKKKQPSQQPNMQPNRGLPTREAVSTADSEDVKKQWANTPMAAAPNECYHPGHKVCHKGSLCTSSQANLCLAMDNHTIRKVQPLLPHDRTYKAADSSLTPLYRDWCHRIRSHPIMIGATGSDQWPSQDQMPAHRDGCHWISSSPSWWGVTGSDPSPLRWVSLNQTQAHLYVWQRAQCSYPQIAHEVN